jgi:ABC-type phosphate transport system substrate-binding protein
MRRGALLLLATTLAASLVPPGAAPAGAAEEFVVVVNEANPVTHLPRAEVSRLFLKRAGAWPDGTPVTPFDLSATSPVRKAFTLAVHQKPLEVIRTYWDQEIYAGRSMPPKVHSTEQSVLHAVRGEKGSIGYVSAGSDLGPGLRVLTLDP